MFNPCFLIPVYNHERALPHTVSQLKRYQLPCIIVDDGSESHCEAAIKALAEREPLVHVFRHQQNRGKGAAVKTGLQHAEELGFTHVFQVDADGQHNTEDVPRFLQQARRYLDAVIVGYAVYDENVPKARFYGRYLTHIWVWINTLSRKIRDSMCGFRIYPVHSTNKLIKRARTGNRMDFDSEILVRAVWSGMSIINLGTQVRYPLDGVSHFRGFEDNALISAMHARLFFGMLLRLPGLLWRRAA